MFFLGWFFVRHLVWGNPDLYFWWLLINKHQHFDIWSLPSIFEHSGRLKSNTFYPKFPTFFNSRRWEKNARTLSAKKDAQRLARSWRFKNVTIENKILEQ